MFGDPSLTYRFLLSLLFIYALLTWRIISYHHAIMHEEVVARLDWPIGLMTLITMMTLTLPMTYAGLECTTETVRWLIKCSYNTHAVKFDILVKRRL